MVQQLSRLFEPGRIGKMVLKNRIIMAPMGVPRIATRGGYLSKEYLAFYEARAKGGVGFIQMSISALGKPWATGLTFAPGSLSIVDDEHLPSARRFVDAMHDHGVKVSFQITHHGAVLSWMLHKMPPEKRPRGLRVVAPSPVPFSQTGEVPHALTVSEIHALVEAFGEAAKRGKAAGFDAVRIQACHGYLIHQFLSRRTNKRADEYGGSLQNRARFACEITRRIRQEVGPDYPVIIRLNGNDFLEGGITVADAVQHAQLFAEAGVDALDVSSGPFESHHWQFLTMYQPSGALVSAAAAIKKAVKVPVMTVGKIDALMAERILQEGSADFVQFGRPLIVDPELPNKAMEGRWEDIRPCIYCDTCMRSLDSSTCSVNPAFAKELEYTIEPAQQSKKVWVVGGGIAGMEAARTLAERGHKVTLYEKSDKLGGQWNVLSAYRPEQGSLVRYLSRQLDKTGVKVVVGEEATQQMVEEMKPDAVVVATGASPATLDDVPGIDGERVVFAHEVLTGKVQTGNEVVVVITGRGSRGLAAALFLAEQGKTVSVVAKSKIAWGLNHNIKLALLENLIKLRVAMFPDSTLESVTDKGVHIIWDGGEPPERGGPRYEVLFLRADSVVLAAGLRSENALGERLSGFMPEIYRIGDCVEPRGVLAAIHEASEVGRKI
ncbi:MAG: hypothetical protein A3G80_08840 [Betaproteobacteria bacterium RIFCSPLOWO2_12_FULL_62_13b]|nr:MAG: hypothetical protein A3G80_08840 [Betaproteobacteria bacterium RIFCSPLOWO2_12_FULL_62_13b]